MARSRSLLLLAAAIAGTLVLNAGPQEEDQSAKTVKVDVNLVLVSASVTDSAGQVVTDLSADNFQIWEDKVEQNILSFSTEDAPLSLGIIFDVSDSMKNKIDIARQAVATFLQMGNPDDEYFLVKFASRAAIVEDFTNDILRLGDRLSFTAAKGNTAMYGIYLGLNKVRSGQNARKALLLITDGGDNYSHYSRRDLYDMARESDVKIYTISFGGIGGAAADLSQISGGQVFRASPLDLEDVCRKIAMELKSQYVLGYASTNSLKDGKWRKILVKATALARTVPHLYVRAKSGYYAPTH